MTQNGTLAASRADHRHALPESVFFVNTTAEAEPSQASIRKKARSHVMTQYHKKARRLRETEKSPHDAGAPVISRKKSNDEQSQPVDVIPVPRPRIGPIFDDIQSGNFAHAKNLDSLTGSHEWEEVISDITGQRISSPSRLDPFGTVPFPFLLDHRDRNLLFHYSTVFNYTNIPVNSKQEWMKFAVTDAALLHTTLVISALHVALLRGTKFSVDAFRHQGAAVKILNDRLSDPILSSMDSTILSISCLALIEILNASPLAAAPHVKALEHLVNQRGGLPTVGFNGIVQRKVLWADLSSAIAQQAAPRFPFSSDALLVEFPYDAIPDTVDTAINICAEVSEWVAGSRYTSCIATIIHDLQKVSLVLTTTDRTDIAKIDQLMLSDYFYDIERRAYDLLQVESPYSFSQLSPEDLIHISPISLLHVACCLTAIIYVSLALREIPPRAGIFNPLLARLTTILSGIDILTACTTYPKTILWILGTGGAVALGREERKLYVMWLDGLCRARNIYGWDNMRIEITNSIHLAPRFMVEFLGVWNELEELRMMRDLD